MLGSYGGNVLSPNLDSLAADGVQLSQFCCVAAACSPSRYNYLTGRYSSRCHAAGFAPQSGAPCNIWFNCQLDPARERSLPHRLQAAGYRTGFVGKWHLGGSAKDQAALPSFDADEDPYAPDVAARMRQHQAQLAAMVQKNGFDVADRVVDGNHQGVPDAARGHNLEWTTEGALAFLDGCADDERPFFLNVATTTIHAPDHAASLHGDPRMTVAGPQDGHLGCQASRASIYERLRDADLPYNSTTAGVLWMDDAVGALLQRLRELGIEENTIVVYATDHGFSGGKFSVYEAGLRIPFIIKWPDNLPAGVQRDGLAHSVDLAPTLLDLVGVEPAADAALDGSSLVPLLREGTSLHDMLYSEFGYTRAIRTARWKYIAWRLPELRLAAIRSDEPDALCTHFGRPIKTDQVRATLMTPLILNHPHYFDADQLYDLEADPYERHNLIDEPEHQQIADQLRERLLRQLTAFEHEFPLDRVDGIHTVGSFDRQRQRALSCLRQGEDEYDRIAEVGGFGDITAGFYADVPVKGRVRERGATI